MSKRCIPPKKKKKSCFCLQEVLQHSRKHQQGQDNGGCVGRVAQWSVTVANMARDNTRDASLHTTRIVSFVRAAFLGVFAVSQAATN